MAMHPALRRCTPEPWPYDKVSMSGVCSQCYKLWGELFMQMLFWMGTFKVFWSSKQQSIDELKTGFSALAIPHPTLPKLQPQPIPTQAVDENSFTIMRFNANGIGNKLTELGKFLKRHNIKVTVIQESKLYSNSKTSIQNFTIVRTNCCQGQGKCGFWL